MLKKIHSLDFKSNSRFRRTSYILLTAALYTVVAVLGLTLATINQQASPVWPATGVAVVCIYIFGYPAAIGVLLGAFLSNYNTDIGVAPSFCIAIGNALEGLFAVWLFKLLVRKPNTLGIHSRAIFGLLSIGSAAVISATNATVVLYFFSVITLERAYPNWLTWWVGDSLGALFLVPLFLQFSYASLGNFRLKKSDRAKIVALLVLNVMANYFVFRVPEGSPFFVVLLFPILLVAQYLRAGWIYLFALLTCGFAILATAFGHGPFTGSSLNENLIHLQLFLGALGLTSIGLGSLQQEALSRHARMALILGWILTGVAVHSFYGFGVDRDRLYFESRADDAQEEVTQRLEKYGSLLKSGASFFESSQYVSGDEWKTFSRRILGERSYDELDGIGVIFASPSTDFKTFKKYNKLDNTLAEFKIKPLPDVPPANSVLSAETHFIITYLEPHSPEVPLIGYDFSTEINRYQAALLARNTGQASLSKQVALVRLHSRPPGFLLFYPFYRADTSLSQAAERVRAHRGFIFATINASKFLKSTLRNRERQVLLSIYESGPGNTQNKIYQSPGKAAISNMKIVNAVNLAGQPLTFEWTVGPDFYSTRGYITSWAALTGALCSLFLAILVAGLENLTLQAQTIADEKTKELRQQKQKWQILTETSPVGIFQTDSNSNVIYINPRLSELSGIADNEMLSHLWLRALHPDDIPLIASEWRRFRDGGKFEMTFRFLNKADPSKFIFVVALAVPVKNEHGLVTGYIGTLQDITDLQQKQSALIASSRLSSLGEMASGVAHEINNPLTIILARAQRIETMLSSVTFDKTVLLSQTVQIMNTTHRIAKIIRGLQSFARETTGEPFEIVRVQDVITNTLELCKERFGSHGVKLLSPVVVPDEFQFWGREEQISQVLMNLLNNAFDAIENIPSKWIEVSVARLGSKLQLSVKDSGAGISKELEEKIFRPFFTTKDVGKGTGLGLSISTGIVERHGGRLYLDRTGEHTKFVIELGLYSGAAT